MADIKISFNSLGDIAEYQSHCFLTKHRLILEVESIKNTKLIICGRLSCYCSVFTLGFEKCNFKVHLVCEINCLGGKHITCWLALNAEKYSAT